MKQQLYLTNYIVEHSVSLPSQAIDYDTDPSNYNRRFPVTCIHWIKFYDNITYQPILEFNCSSETCAEIIAALCDAPSIYEMDYKIEGIYLSDYVYPVTMSIINYNGYIQFIVHTSFSSGINSVASLLPDDAYNLMELLKTEDLDDLICY